MSWAMQHGSKVLASAVKRPPNAGKGRKKGVPNKATAALKDAILLAAEDVGEDGKGKGGLQGYLRRVATDDVKAFASLLGRVLPLQIRGTVETPVASKEQRDAAVAAFFRSKG
jgi:hypothetical protein